MYGFRSRLRAPASPTCSQCFTYGLCPGCCSSSPPGTLLPQPIHTAYSAVLFTATTLRKAKCVLPGSSILPFLLSIFSAISSQRGLREGEEEHKARSKALWGRAQATHQGPQHCVGPSSTQGASQQVLLYFWDWEFFKY